MANFSKFALRFLCLRSPTFRNMRKASYPVVTLFGISCFLVAFFISQRIFNSNGKGWEHIVSSDGRGYYAYLPALIIDGDLTFGKVAERESRFLGNPHHKPGYLVRVNSHPLNKYFAGEALLLLPFFLFGLFFSFIFGLPVDGYSFFFQISTGLGALFYLVTGLYYLSRILAYFEIRPVITAWCLALILFGTNLLYYTIWQPTMSHVYSFFAINGLLYYLLLAIRSWNNTTALLTGLFLGLVFLVRPTNLIVLLLLPFLAGNLSSFFAFLRVMWIRKRITILFFLVVILLAAVQPVLWFLQTGKFFIWSYQNEGFIFSRPEIINVLFSFRKGLFIYTPMILLSWTGLIFLAISNRVRFFSMLLFIALSSYVISSWWNWYYGDGFGLRAFIDYYGIFCLLLALPLNRLPGKTAYFLIVFLILPVSFLNLFQTWQYTRNAIQPNSMNHQKYCYIFLKADSAHMNGMGGNQELADFTVDLKRPELVFQNNFETKPDSWNNISIQNSSRAFSQDHVGYLDSLHQFSPGLEIKTSQLGILPSRFFLEGELMVWDSIMGASNKALVVLSMDSINGRENYWQGFSLNDIPRNDMKSWRKCRFSLTIPEIVNHHGVLKIYIWNTGKDPFLLDNFTLRFYRVK